MNKNLTLALLLVSAAASRAQITDTEPGSVANIPVNYTESKTGSYTLPDPLKFSEARRSPTRRRGPKSAGLSSSSSSKKTNTGAFPAGRPP